MAGSSSAAYAAAAGAAALGEEELEPTLRELCEQTSLKWIFVGGKGGVGKTTTSCSIAVELARRRDKVLILSTDPAHNLSDAFTQKFTNQPTKVNGFENLFAMEIDSSYQEQFEFRLKQDEGWAKALPELLSAFPGIDEALSFAELMQSVQTMDYDVIIFDTAPTGHTLRLLSFPDLLEKAFSKLASIKNKMSGALQMLNMVAGQSFNEEEIHSRLDGLRAVTTSVREAFQDPTRTTFVCVCIPEFLSVYETERLVQELAKQGIDSSNIVVNQVLFPIGEGRETDFPPLPPAKALPAGSAPEAAALSSENQELRHRVEALATRLRAFEVSHFARRKMQSKYLAQIQDLYAFDFHVVCMPVLTEEVRGVERLRNFAGLLLTPKPLPLVQSSAE